MGIVAIAVVVQSILAVIGAAGIPAVVTRTYFRGEDGPQRARLLMRRCFSAAVAVAIVADVTGPLWSEAITDLGYVTSLRLAVWSAVPIAMVVCSQAILRAEDKAGRYVTTAIGTTAFAQLLGLVIVAATVSEATPYVAGLLIGQTVAAVLGIAWAGFGETAGTDSSGLTRASLKIGLPTVFHSIAIYVLGTGDRVLIETTKGLEAVGRYQVAYQIGAVALAIIAAFSPAWEPIVFAAPENRRWHTLADTRAVIYRIAGMLAAAIAIGAPVALAIAAPSEYQPSELSPVTAIVALSAIPMVSYMASFYVLIWVGKTTVMAWATPLAAGANIGLCLLLLPDFGLEGAAVATVLAYVLLAVIITTSARREVPDPGDLRPLLSAAAIAGTGVALSLVGPTDGAWLAVRAVVAIGLGLAVLSYATSLVRSRPRSEPADATAGGAGGA